MTLLPASFYQHNDVVRIARELLGKHIIVHAEGYSTGAIIVETEAYKGPEDKACHAYNNKYTERTKTMFLPGGYTYVYLCYGIHRLFNVVTGDEGCPHAVLIRAVEPIKGIEIMQTRRGFSAVKPALTAGPGRWTQAMGIDLHHNSILCYEHNSPITIKDAHVKINKSSILASPRVGINYAEEWIDVPWRFRLATSNWTSK